MATNITVPKLGMTMKDAALVEWKFNEGDRIEKGDVVLIIETEKTTWEVEAMGAGFLHILIPANPDKPEPVGMVVGLLAETEEELAALQKETGVVAAPAAAEAQAASAEAATPAPAGAAAPSGAAAQKGGRLRISPVARKMAEAQGIDPGTITGSGPGGRITKKDVEKAIESKSAAPAEAAAAPPAGDVIDGKRVRESVSLKSGMRKFIARHMQQSLAVSAQLTSMGEVDMSEAIKFRAELVEKEEILGTRITFTDIFIVAVTKALKALPIINSSIIGDEIKIWDDINIGVAVALEGQDKLGGGLIVPVIKNADQKSLTDISKELKGIVQKARDGEILPDDVTGSTFTITNLGGMGGGYGFGTPIINQPESAILGTGSTSDRPVVRDGEIVIRPIMTFSFTFDHRVIDGVPAGAFMRHVVVSLQNPLIMLC